MLMRLYTLIFCGLQFLHFAPACAEWNPSDGKDLNYTQVLFTWDQMPNAIAYEIEISNDDTTVLNLIDSTLSCLIDTGLQWGNDYSWRVRSIISDGVTGEWSVPRNFQIMVLPSIPGYTINNPIPGLYTPGLTMFDINGRILAIAVNQTGAIKWFLASPLYSEKFRITHFLPNGNFLAYKDPNGHGTEITREGGIFWRGSNDLLHHDFVKLDNGHYMGIRQVSVSELKYVTLPFNSTTNPYINWVGDAIVEFNEDGQIVWSWSTHDHFSKEDFNYIHYQTQAGGSHDWTHSNSIHFDTLESVIYFSTRNLSRITKIAYPAGDVIWMLGYSLPSGDVTIGNDFNINYQHAISKLANGNLLMFNNGGHGTPPISTALEIEIGGTDSIPTAEISWQSVLPDTMYGSIMGDSDRLISGNTLITTGQSGYIVEVAPDSQIVWSLKLEGVLSHYRSERITNLYPQAHSIVGPDFALQGNARLISADTIQNTLTFNFINEGWAKQSYNYQLLSDSVTTYHSGQIALQPGESNSVHISLTFDAFDEFVDLDWIVTNSTGDGTSDTVHYLLQSTPNGTSADGTGIPIEFKFYQNYPNPFNPVTTIQYELPEKSDVQITIYDLLGKEVKTLVSETQPAGYKSVQWNAANNMGQPVSAGVYLYQIRVGTYVQTNKMILLK